MEPASKLMLGQLMLLRPLLSSIDIEASRRGQDALGALGARTVSGRVEYVPESKGEYESEWAFPVQENGGYAVVYLHGGAYVSGSLPYAKGFGGVLADLLGVPVLCVGYRLAPENPFPAALDDALDSYRTARAKYPLRKIAIVGESAGGGLVFALALKLKETGEPLPEAIAAISPWTDLTFSGVSFKTNADIDPMLSEKSLRADAIMYRGSVTADNPFVSPVFGELKGLPPTIVTVGTGEILQSDGFLMTTALKKAGVFCESVVANGMWHVYPLFPVPEAKAALEQIKLFLDKECGTCEG